MNLAITKTLHAPAYENSVSSGISKTIEFFTADTYSEERSALWKGMTSAFVPTQYKIQDVVMMGAVLGIGLVASGGLLGLGLGALDVAGDLMSAAHVYSSIQQITTERDENIRLAAFASLGSTGVNVALSGLLLGASWLTLLINPIKLIQDVLATRKARQETKELQLIHGAANRIIEVINKESSNRNSALIQLSPRKKYYPENRNLTFACVTPPRYVVPVAEEVVTKLRQKNSDTNLVHIISIEEPKDTVPQVAQQLLEQFKTPNTHIIVTIPDESRASRMRGALSDLSSQRNFQGKLTIISGNHPRNLPVISRNNLELTSGSSGAPSLADDSRGALSIASEQEGLLTIAEKTSAKKIPVTTTPLIYGYEPEPTSLHSLVDWAEHIGKFVHIDLDK